MPNGPAKDTALLAGTSCGLNYQSFINIPQVFFFQHCYNAIATEISSNAISNPPLINNSPIHTHCTHQRDIFSYTPTTRPILTREYGNKGLLEIIQSIITIWFTTVSIYCMISATTCFSRCNILTTITTIVRWLHTLL